MLERARIRNDVFDRLRAAYTIAGDNIFKSRLTDVIAAECPAASVYTQSETGQGIVGSQIPDFSTVVFLKIDVYVAAEDGWDDELDTLCEEIERAILNAPDFAREFSDIVSYSTTVQQEPDITPPVASATMTIGLGFRNDFPPLLEDSFKFADINVTYDGDPTEPANDNDEPVEVTVGLNREDMDDL